MILLRSSDVIACAVRRRGNAVPSPFRRRSERRPFVSRGRGRGRGRDRGSVVRKRSKTCLCGRYVYVALRGD